MTFLFVKSLDSIEPDCSAGSFGRSTTAPLHRKKHANLLSIDQPVLRNFLLMYVSAYSASKRPQRRYDD